MEMVKKMTATESRIAWIAGVGVFVAVAIGLLCTTISLSHRLRDTAVPLAASPAVRATMGNVTVRINDQTAKPLPSVLTTEQVADELEVNADTIRRRESTGGLVGYAKKDRNTWVRVVHDSSI